MADQENAYLTDECVFWRATGREDRYGNSIVQEPVQLSPLTGNGVKWDTNRRNTLDANGNLIALDGSAIVSFDVPVGSRVWRGTVEDYMETGSGDAEPDAGVMEVTTFDKVQDLKGRSFTRRVGLMRWRQKEV